MHPLPQSEQPLAPAKQKPAEILKIKKKVRKRDGMKCTKCGITNRKYKSQRGRSLDVHRMIPGSLYTVEGCITVCASCHGKEPRRAPGVPDLAIPERHMVGLPERIAKPLEEIADERETNVTELVKSACIEFLKQNGKWPPKPTA